MNKKILLLVAVLISIAVGSYFLFRKKEPKWEEVAVEQSAFTVTVSASGTVEPENKISIISPISGRIDKIMIEEGTEVKRGEVLAWMSSTDRAALLDSAQVQGGKTMKEWSDVYKPTPILSPAAGVIIAKNIVVGQTVNPQTILFALSDHLVVIADVDETDLGKIKQGQTANVTVDSFPELSVETKVVRIAHQSKLKNAINTYEVLLVPENLPQEFRAGLTASVQFVYLQKEKALLLPTWIAEGRENFEKEVTVKGPKPEKRKIRFGLSNGQKVEVLEGLAANDILLVQPQKVLSDKAPATVFGIGGSRGRRR